MLGLIREFVDLLLENQLPIEQGKISILSRSMKLVHNSKMELDGAPRLSSGPEQRLIPRSFSLARPGEWWFMGDVRTNFLLRKGSRILSVNRQQFFAWGPETTTPLHRGELIRQWAGENGIDVIKISGVQDTEFAVINLDCIQKI